MQGAETAAPDAVSANLAASVVPRLADGRDTILLTGGATAAAVLARLGISQLRLSGECLPGLPGLPVSHAGGFTFVTKSGGFGSAGTLAEVLRRVSPR